MNSIIATNTLYEIYNFLCKNNITLNNIITYGSQFDLSNILLQTNLDPIYEEWDHNQKDDEAMKLIPKKYEDYICIISTPNGNCFFNSASLIVFGHEDNNIQLRLAVIVELMAHADHYLQQPVFEQDVFYRDEALNNINIVQDNSFKKAKEYISELKLMCKPYSWCSMIAFFGLASVLHRPVESLFPNTGSEFMNQAYNRIIMPRQDEYFHPHCIIMWSSISAINFQNSGRADHFVPVFKQKEYNYSNLSKIQSLKNPILSSVKESSLQNNYINLTVETKSDDEEYINQEEQDKTLIGLLMGIDNAYIPNISKIDNYLIYPEAKDFQFKITSQQAVSSLLTCSIDENQVTNYYWRPWQISNSSLFELLIKQPEFPPQISISVRKTCETNKALVKYCYCGGCNETIFRIIINQMDLIQAKEFVMINIIYSINKRQCKHLDGKIYGQCRGNARQRLAGSTEFKSPRDMRKKILSTVKNEVRYTGNRQGIPSAYSARTIFSSKNKENKLGYNLCERLHATILDINNKEKDDYIKTNGTHLVNKRQLWGFIQDPIQTQPLSIVIFNEAGIYYYHKNVSKNPGIFLDYTGGLVKPVPQYLTSLNNSDNCKRILNAFFTMPSSENSSDAPPVDVFELVTNDLSSKNLQQYLHVYRQKELQLFNSNSVPFLINTDCAQNLLVAILREYNNESVNQYINRIMNSIVNGHEFDNSKTFVGWCFGHAIRAIRHHIKSKKFITELGCNRDVLSKFAMRVWNSVRVKENLSDIEKEIEKWEWIMCQEYLELTNKKIKLVNKKRFNGSLDEDFDMTNIPDLCFNFDYSDSINVEKNMDNNPMRISNLLNQEELDSWTYSLNDNILLKFLLDNNKNYKLLVPQLDITVNIQLSQLKNIKNPFYSLNLMKYLDKVWWKTVVLWSNLLPAIRNRTRRTTATVEVENHIVKNLDIGKKNLPIDQYICVRTQTLRSTQNLIAETLMRKR